MDVAYVGAALAWYQFVVIEPVLMQLVGNSARFGYQDEFLIESPGLFLFCYQFGMVALKLCGHHAMLFWRHMDSGWSTEDAQRTPLDYEVGRGHEVARNAT